MQKSKLKTLLFILSVFFIPTTSLAATFDSAKGTVVLYPNEYASKFMYTESGTGGQQNFQFVYTKNDKGTYTMTQVFEGGRSSDGKSVTYTDKSDKYANVMGTYDGMKNLANAGIDTTHMANGSNLGLVKLSSGAVEQKGGDLVQQQLIANAFFTGINGDTKVDMESVNSALDSKAYTSLVGDNQQGSGKLRDGSKDPTDTAGQAEQIKTSALTGGLALPENIGNATLGNALVPDRGVTYTNNSTSLCGSNGCTYTLMAPIGSLLGKEDGKYVINKSDKGGLCVLFNSWFRIGIALAGMLAVVMIVLGGFQYATTDAMTSKSEGKSKIQNALWGLMLALTTWLVLNTVNPDLVNCTINASDVQLSAEKGNVNRGSVVGATNGVLTTGSSVGGIFNDFSFLNNFSNSNSGNVHFTAYGYPGDLTPDTNSRQRRGNNSNLLVSGSVALSPDLISQFNAKPGAAVYVNSRLVGYYDDRTAEGLTNRVDLFDPDASLGGNNFSKKVSGTIVVDNNNRRAQTPNPSK